MKSLFFLFVSFFLLLPSSLFAKGDSIEVFLIEAYITDEKPDTLTLTFATSDDCYTKVFLNNTEVFSSNEMLNFHNLLLDVSKLKADEGILRLRFENTAQSGKTYKSDVYDVRVPRVIIVEDGGSYLLSCITGAIIYMIPSPGVAFFNSDQRIFFTKEIPIIVNYSGGFNYPSSYISAEYSHMPDSRFLNLAGLGYKYIFEIPVIEYFSIGINGRTDFLGFNSVSPEISIGLLKLTNVFTIYARARYNFQPGIPGNEFTEVSIGLFSHFFSFNF